MRKLLLSLLLLIALPASADQYLYGYGWTGGYGVLGQCLISNGPTAQPSFQACGGGGGSGTVTSVSLTTPSWLTVTGSPVTTTGTLAVAATTGQTANSFLATPNGSTGIVGLRTIVAADLPALGANPTATIGTAAANGTATTYLRSDAAPGINLGMTPTWTGTHSWTGNSVTITAAGVVTAGQFGVNQTSLPANGIYRPAANILGFATNSIAHGQIAADGLASMYGIASYGTKFTAAGTGCTVGTTVGGATAGTFTLAAGPCTSVAITMAGATGITALNGWTCQAHDRTAPTVLIGGESASTTTTATITIPAGAGATDVISFSCTGY